MSTVNDSSQDTGRRRSGRIIRKPGLFADEQFDTTVLTNGSAKRKRASKLHEEQTPATDDDDDNDDDDDHVGNDSDDSEDEENEDEADVDDTEVSNRRSRNKKTAVAKPAIKRPRIANGTSTTLAIRSAAVPSKSATKFAKQKARSRPSQVDAAGLYAEVFGKSNSAEDAAGVWHEALLQDNVGGIRELVNFILKSIECEAKIENADVEDIDNVPTRLGDVLEEYAHQKTADYPLASKMKQYVGFKEVLTEFCNAVVHILHNSGVLYDEPAVYDNIHIWTATMSGAGYRPFRHTATVISLSMTTALCQVAQVLQSSMATTKTQIETEKKKKKNTNKARVTSLQKDQHRDEKRLEAIDSLLRDAFDTVYVHRYRDVDEKIRVECVTALGNWIVLYRKMFLEGQYLRYLGWVLSDPNAQTRLEVVKALKMLFKNRNNVGALRAFTDRFRPRLVEMGARDTDISVRAETIELLDRLRNAELLEPDDVDTIGQLIFDNESRIRKAVAKFFVSNIEDLYESIVDQYDKDAYASAVPQHDEDQDFLEPTQSWIKFKCLAQTLVSHDKHSDVQTSSKRLHGVYGAEDSESRFVLAAQSIFPYMPELSQWESLAGYLLYDHSGITAQVDDPDVNLAAQGAFKLTTGEDMALLDVLHLCFRLSLQQILDSQNEKKKRSQAGKAEVQKRQEEAASNLTIIIPQLLNKFGSIPEAAASILRLEQLLNIDLIADLQAGEATYETILETINKQFTSHNDRKVLAEASKAFRTARSYETSKEAADAKVAEIWSDSREALSSLLRDKNLMTRGTFDRNTLREIGNILARLAQLAAVSDCTEVLESHMSGFASKKPKRQSKSGQEVFVQVLLQLLSRGVHDEDTTDQFAELEDRLCESTLTVLSFYFRWKIVALKNAVITKDTKSLSTDMLVQLATMRSSLNEAIQPVISTRQPLDSIRVSAILTSLDMFTLFATVRHIKPSKGELADEIQTNLQNLVTTMPSDLVELVMETHEKMERRLAKKTNKRIDTPVNGKKKTGSRKRRAGATNDDGEVSGEEDVEKPPEDSDDENEDENSDSESDDIQDSEEEAQLSGSRGREARKQSALLAEQSLCELTSKVVLAIIAAVIQDYKGGKVKNRLQTNRTRLGKSYGQVIAYLDEKKEREKKKPMRKSVEGTASPAITAAVDGQHVGTTAIDKTRQRQTPLSEPMVLVDEEENGGDDLEDDEADHGREEGDEEDLRERGLEDDPVEEEGMGEDDNDDEEEDEEDEEEVEGGGGGQDDDHSNDVNDDDVMGD